MSRARGWMLLLLLGVFFVICAEQAKAEPVQQPAHTELWHAIAPELAPRRVQALNGMVHRHLARAGFDTPRLPVWSATTIDGWNTRLPEGAIAFADARGSVLNAEWTDFAAEQWPPMVDTVRILIHEQLHQLQAVPGGAYGDWTPQQRAIEEGRVEAASILLADTFMRRHWPRMLYMAMTDSYPSCVRVIQVTAARATNTKLSTRTARSFTFWLMRTDIDTAVALAYEHGLHEDLANCEAETDQRKENTDA